MDFSDYTVNSQMLTSALNATILTFNGNENMLQNDMGNARVDEAFLPAGFVPVGMKSFGGIVYVASHNPLTKQSQIGCFPSPERNVSSDENGRPNVYIMPFTEDTVQESSGTSDSKYKFASNIKGISNAQCRKLSIMQLTQKCQISDTLRPGDKFSIHIEKEELKNILQYLKNGTASVSVAVIDSQGNFSEIAKDKLNSWFWYNQDGEMQPEKPTPAEGETFYDCGDCIYISYDDPSGSTRAQERFYVRTFISSAEVTDTKEIVWNTYKNKIIGDLYLIVKLNVPETLNLSINGAISPDVSADGRTKEGILQIDLPAYYTLNLEGYPAVFSDLCGKYKIHSNVRDAKPYYHMKDVSIGDKVNDGGIGMSMITSASDLEIGINSIQPTGIYWQVVIPATKEIVLISQDFIKEHAFVAIDLYKFETSHGDSISLKSISDQNVVDPPNYMEFQDGDRTTPPEHGQGNAFKKVVRVDNPSTGDYYVWYKEHPQMERSVLLKSTDSSVYPEEMLCYKVNGDPELKESATQLSYSVVPYFRIAKSDKECYSNGWLKPLSVSGSLDLFRVATGEVDITEVSYQVAIEEEYNYRNLKVMFGADSYLKPSQAAVGAEILFVDYCKLRDFCENNTSVFDITTPDGVRNLRDALKNGQFKKAILSTPLVFSPTLTGQFITDIALDERETDSFGTRLSASSIYLAWIEITIWDQLTQQETIKNSQGYTIITSEDMREAENNVITLKYKAPQKTIYNANLTVPATNISELGVFSSEQASPVQEIRFSGQQYIFSPSIDSCSAALDVAESFPIYPTGKFNFKFKPLSTSCAVDESLPNVEVGDFYNTLDTFKIYAEAQNEKFSGVYYTTNEDDVTITIGSQAQFAADLQNTTISGIQYRSFAHKDIYRTYTVGDSVGLQGYTTDDSKKEAARVMPTVYTMGTHQNGTKDDCGVHIWSAVHQYNGSAWDLLQGHHCDSHTVQDIGYDTLKFLPSCSTLFRLISFGGIYNHENCSVPLGTYLAIAKNDLKTAEGSKYNPKCFVTSIVYPSKIAVQGAQNAFAWFHPTKGQFYGDATFQASAVKFTQTAPGQFDFKESSPDLCTSILTPTELDDKYLIPGPFGTNTPYSDKYCQGTFSQFKGVNPKFKPAGASGKWMNQYNRFLLPEKVYNELWQVAFRSKRSGTVTKSTQAYVPSNKQYAYNASHAVILNFVFTVSLQETPGEDALKYKDGSISDDILTSKIQGLYEFKTDDNIEDYSAQSTLHSYDWREFLLRMASGRNKMGVIVDESVVDNTFDSDIAIIYHNNKWTNSVQRFNVNDSFKRGCWIGIHQNRDYIASLDLYIPTLGASKVSSSTLPELSLYDGWQDDCNSYIHNIRTFKYACYYALRRKGDNHSFYLGIIYGTSNVTNERGAEYADKFDAKNVTFGIHELI